MNYIIANPPASIYKGDINIGYAFYHVLLDVHARYMATKSGLNIVGPKFSLNVFGKRADKLSNQANEEDFRRELDDYVNQWILENRLRDHLNLLFEGTVSDNDDKSVQEAQKTFVQLWKDNYLIRKDERYFLDVKRIAKERDLEGAIGEIKFYPERSKDEFIRLIRTNTNEPVEITKSTRYSVKNPFGGENLGPLFVSATLWEGHYDKKIDLLAIGEKGLTRYGLLRFLIRMATNKDPLTKKIFCFNKVDPEGGFDNWDMNELTKNPYETDILRYALVRSHSLTSQKTELKRSLLDGGKNFIYLIGNLGKFFAFHLGEIKESEGKVIEDDPNYQEDMESFKFNKSLTNLEMELRDLSKKVAMSRDRGNPELSFLFLKYETLLEKIKPFVPAITLASEKRIGREK